jgi:hypothetical protein
MWSQGRPGVTSALSGDVVDDQSVMMSTISSTTLQRGLAYWSARSASFASEKLRTKKQEP